MPDRFLNETLQVLLANLEAALAASRRRPCVLGIAGAQGAGKSTIARRLAFRLEAQGLKPVILALDDFYLSRAERRRVAAAVNPLLTTRGPPGTHDVDLLRSALAALRRRESLRVPVFEKARDERAAPGDWPTIPGGVDVVIFEGWCLGAAPEPSSRLAAPINMFERAFDADGGWRRAVNEALAGPYQSLFGEIDHLVYLRPPTFEVVLRWRTEQEHALAAAPHARTAPGVMTAEEISFFIQHFERLTRWMMEDVPARAALTLQLDERRRIAGTMRQGQ